MIWVVGGLVVMLMCLMVVMLVIYVSKQKRIQINII